MIELSKEHIAAIREAVKKVGGKQADFAAIVGLSPSYISRYISGETKRISPQTWERLLPQIEKYLEPQPKDLLAKSQNQLTAPMIRIFEDLKPDRARIVFEEADRLLREQTTSYFVRLTDQEMEELNKHGVFVHFTAFENNITCSPVGLCWLVNMTLLARCRGEYLSPLLLRELLRTPVYSRDARELCVRMFSADTYTDGESYWQWTFYLMGTPPPWYCAELEAGNAPVANGFSFPPSANLPFRLHDEIEWFNVVFSEDEIADMKSGSRKVYMLSDEN